MTKIQDASNIQEAYDTSKQPPPFPLLSIYELRQFIDVEYNIFIFLLKIIIKINLQESRSSPFAQAINDVVTLGNHKNYQLFGIQFIDPGWQNNNIVCIEFVWSRDGTNQGVKSLL